MTDTTIASTMRSPSSYLPSKLARALLGNPGLLLLAVVTMALGEPMRVHSDALITLAAPHGILSLQFTCSDEGARGILAIWDAAALRHATLSLLWDSGFAPAYGITLALLTERITNQSPDSRRGWLARLAWLPLWAAASDLIENLFHACLVGAFDCGIWNGLAGLACGFALLKWSLLAMWLLTLTGLGLRRILGRSASR